MGVEIRTERVFTTLIRDQHQGLGFSISGGKGAESFIEGSEAVYISKVAEDGPAAKDAKLIVGDKLIQVRRPRIIFKSRKWRCFVPTLCPTDYQSCF